MKPCWWVCIKKNQQWLCKNSVGWKWTLRLHTCSCRFLFSYNYSSSFFWLLGGNNPVGLALQKGFKRARCFCHQKGPQKQIKRWPPQIPNQTERPLVTLRDLEGPWETCERLWELGEGKPGADCSRWGGIQAGTCWTTSPELWVPFWNFTTVSSMFRFSQTSWTHMVNPHTWHLVYCGHCSNQTEHERLQAAMKHWIGASNPKNLLFDLIFIFVLNQSYCSGVFWAALCASMCSVSTQAKILCFATVNLQPSKTVMFLYI